MPVARLRLARGHVHRHPAQIAVEAHRCQKGIRHHRLPRPGRMHPVLARHRVVRAVFRERRLVRRQHRPKNIRKADALFSRDINVDVAQFAKILVQRVHPRLRAVLRPARDFSHAARRTQNHPRPRVLERLHHRR